MVGNLVGSEDVWGPGFRPLFREPSRQPDQQGFLCSCLPACPTRAYPDDLFGDSFRLLSYSGKRTKPHFQLPFPLLNNDDGHMVDLSPI